MATLATETWTGANGAAWPAQWTATGGTSTIQANRGRMVTAATASTYNTATRYLSGMANATDTDVTVTIYPTTTAFQYVMLRICGNGIDTTAWEPITGYQLWFTPSAGNVSVELVEYNSAASQTSRLANAASAVPWSATNGFTVRFQRSGTLVRYKIWAGNASEPGAWDRTFTDSDGTVPPTGKVALVIVSNNDGIATTVDFDGLTVTDGAGAPTTLDLLRLGANVVDLRVGTATPSAVYIGTTQVWP